MLPFVSVSRPRKAGAGVSSWVLPSSRRSNASGSKDDASRSEAWTIGLCDDVAHALRGDCLVACSACRVCMRLLSSWVWSSVEACLLGPVWPTELRSIQCCLFPSFDCIHLLVVVMLHLCLRDHRLLFLFGGCLCSPLLSLVALFAFQLLLVFLIAFMYFFKTNASLSRALIRIWT